MILNFVPRIAFIAFGYWDDVLPPVAPTGTSVLLASSMVFTGEVCQVTVVLFSALGLPMKMNFVVSNCSFSPIAWASASDWSAVASTVPSLGATL